MSSEQLLPCGGSDAHATVHGVPVVFSEVTPKQNLISQQWELLLWSIVIARALPFRKVESGGGKGNAEL
ncbi:hypothetical protein Y032_0192g1359 [Ancylostoma ceylanicum]|uniref:Uncharacterized protein n=1 Tax=Ancylostoma ceylanicum TaxID=53326 RepID=A0A016SQD6_9BILA|nr:hypothetical protein Y032_0192g1359 [Ancylostoma ceylanicum]